MPTTQELIDELPDAGDIVAGVTSGHIAHSGIYKQIFQNLLTLIEAIPEGGGGGGGGGGGSGTDPLAIHSPDGSWGDSFVMSKAAFDAKFGAGDTNDGEVYLTLPEA